MRRLGALRSIRFSLSVMLAMAVALLSAPSASAAPRSSSVTPIVLFPAFHFTKLQVTVRNQVAAPGCPRFGSFEDWFLNSSPSTSFSQVCQDELLTLRYRANPAMPMPLRFSNQRGVEVRIADYGKTESAPFYETMYEALEAQGYT